MYRAGSTNNLHRHIRTVEPTVELESKTQAMEPAINEGVSADVAAPASSSTSPQAPRPTIHRSMSQFLQKTMTPAKQKTVDEELAKMIAEDFQPFSTVEDRGFRSYTHALNPMYVLPSRKTLSKKIILQLYYEKHVLLLERVKKKPHCRLSQRLLDIPNYHTLHVSYMPLY